jgi:hypothetical protein
MAPAVTKSCRQDEQKYISVQLANYLKNVLQATNARVWTHVTPRSGEDTIVATHHTCFYLTCHHHVIFMQKFYGPAIPAQIFSSI